MSQICASTAFFEFLHKSDVPANQKQAFLVCHRVVLCLPVLDRPQSYTFIPLVVTHRNSMTYSKYTKTKSKLVEIGETHMSVNK